MEEEVMRAAIYARRSTDEHQEASLEVQVDEAKRFCAARGWIVDDEHIFEEDAVSRAEFKKRPALIRLLIAATDRKVDVIVVRDETRLGGDVTRTGLLIQDILDTGCELVYYFTDERVKLDTAVDKFMMAARNFASELEREKISQRTREHLVSKARKGMNAGGKAYGYRNIRRDDGSPDLEIIEEEAKVVREIYRRYAGGEGFSGIAKDFNKRRIPPPRAGKRGTGSWAPSAIRAMLNNERYSGIWVYGRYKKEYKGGTRVRTKTPSCDWLRVERPELRIIDQALWAEVEARRDKNRRRYGNKSKIGPKHRYLLSGLARCGECGGPMQVETGKHGTKPIKIYSCAYHRKRGSTVCSNSLRKPMDVIDGAVLGWIEQNILKEELVVEIVCEVKKRLHERAASLGPDLSKLEAEIEKTRTEIDNLTDNLAIIGRSPAIAQKLADKEKVLTRLEGEREAALAAPGAIELEARRIEKEARGRIAEFRKLLTEEPEKARKVVDAIVDGHLTFTPVEGATQGYRITGKVADTAMCTIPNVPREACVNGATALHEPRGSVRARSHRPSACRASG